MIPKPSPTWDVRRLGVLALAVLHLGAAAVLPGVDARLDGGLLNAPIHVESPGTDDCPTHHDHLFCQVVRSFSAVEGTGRIGRLLEAMPSVAWLPPNGAPVTAGPPPLAGPVGPRAPPQG